MRLAHQRMCSQSCRLYNGNLQKKFKLHTNHLKSGATRRNIEKNFESKFAFMLVSFYAEFDGFYCSARKFVVRKSCLRWKFFMAHYNCGVYCSFALDSGDSRGQGTS